MDKGTDDKGSDDKAAPKGRHSTFDNKEYGI